jgi:cytochrome d ubiquinol oxidase subunit I
VLGLAVGAVAIPLQILSGDFSARFLADKQPEKFAAMESQFTTEKGAPLRIGGVPNPGAGRTDYAIEIPKLGSFLARHDLNAEVKGLDAFPADARPDPRIVHLSFDVMVASGLLLFLAGSAFFGVAAVKRALPLGRWTLRSLLLCSPLGFVAIEAGWFVTEFGRQPWIVWHLMRVSDAATHQSGVDILLFVVALVYVGLTVGLVLLLLLPHAFGWLRPKRGAGP